MSIFTNVILLILLSITLPASADNDYDIAIVGGRVIDPETGLDDIRNIGITGNKIAIVTQKNIQAAKVIDARGRIVSPGFIDMHAHGQTILAARMQALDGVTTGLELESGVLPVSKYYKKLAEKGRPINYGASANWASARIATFLNKQPKNHPSWFQKSMKETNWQNEIANEKQLANILAMVEEGLDQGALGVGFLLGYAPGTGHKEYNAATQLAVNASVPTYTHARFLSMLEPSSSFESIQEIISVAASTGVHAHIVHLNSISLRDIDTIGAAISGAQSKNINITTEAYPYGAGSTSIGAAMFHGDNWREKIGGITAHNFDVGGKRLSEQEFDYLQDKKPETQTVIHMLDTTNPQDQAFLDKSVLFPGGVIGSDGGEWLINGELVDEDIWPIPEKAWSHPRSAGTFSRFIRLYVRENQQISLLEAIKKLSYGPAKMLQASIPQMKFKGRIQANADADIVIFDLNTVSDKATYIQPAQASIGFDYVLVNGVPLVEQGQLNTRLLPGMAIRNKQKKH
jgi:N-acyl-D-glutamate deacylase